MEGQGETIVAARRETIRMLRETERTKPEKEPDFRVRNQFHPGYREVSRRKKVDRTVPNFILDSTKFGTLYLYRTEVFIDRPCKE